MNDISVIEHFIATVGFPIAITVAVLFVLYRILHKLCCTAGDSVKKWFEAQTTLAEVLKDSIEKQTEILKELNIYASHGHKALYYTLKSVDELSGQNVDVLKNTEKAKDSLLYTDNNDK